MKKSTKTKTTKIINELDPEMEFSEVRLENVPIEIIFSTELITSERKLRKLRKKWEKKGFKEISVEQEESEWISVYGKIWLTKEEVADSSRHGEPLLNFITQTFYCSEGETWWVPKYLKRIYPKLYARTIKKIKGIPNAENSN